MKFLKIPTYTILGFDLLKFAEHVLDTSPVITTRSQMRPVMKAIEAIAEAESGIAVMSDDVAQAFQAACEVAPTPPLTFVRQGASGEPFGEHRPVPKREFFPFYEAVETMTSERPPSSSADEGVEPVVASPLCE